DNQNLLPILCGCLEELERDRCSSSSTRQGADSSIGLELTRNTQTLSEHSPESRIIPAGKPSGETSQLSEPVRPPSAIRSAPPYQPLWMKADCVHTHSRFCGPPALTCKPHIILGHVSEVQTLFPAASGFLSRSPVSPPPGLVVNKPNHKNCILSLGVSACGSGRR
ncbi:hypothetical protein AMECASPLE_037676, partial [Ameca splendens]